MRPILIVENDSLCAKAVEQTFNDLNIKVPLVKMTDAEKALAYLTQESNNMPRLILLCLDAPVEFLSLVKSDKVFRTIPVVILTTSANQDFIAQSFSYCAAGYIIKPGEYEHLLNETKVIIQYWTLCEFPEGK